METTDTLRDEIISKLLSISDEKNLSDINDLVNKAIENNQPVYLTEEQIVMLQLSDADINSGRVISQHELDKADLKWLKGK